jgi:hypothetical protein
VVLVGASQKHSVVVVDSQGRVVEDFEIEHSALGWKKFRERIKPYDSIPFAIETSQGAAVEQLLEAGMEVYPLNPKSAQAYRQRKAPSGVKDDQLDAWSFADALRVDGQNWRPLRPEDPLIKELRLLCRDEVGLIEQRTSFITQLRHALAEYYPTALEAFEDWDSVSAWMFLQRFPTPQLLQKAGKRQWEKFLHSRRLWRNESGPRRLELFAHATEFGSSEPTANAKSMLALSLVQKYKCFLPLKSNLGNIANGSKNSSTHIPITTYSAPCLVLDQSSRRSCSPRSAMIETASKVMRKTSNASLAPHQ